MCQMGCVSAVEGSDVYVCRWYHVVSLTETIEGKFYQHAMCAVWLMSFRFFEGDQPSAGNRFLLHHLLV